MARSEQPRNGFASGGDGSRRPPAGIPPVSSNLRVAARPAPFSHLKTGQAADPLAFWPRLPATDCKLGGKAGGRAAWANRARSFRKNLCLTILHPASMRLLLRIYKISFWPKRPIAASPFRHSSVWNSSPAFNNPKSLPFRNLGNFPPTRNRKATA